MNGKEECYRETKCHKQPPDSYFNMGRVLKNGSKHLIIVGRMYDMRLGVCRLKVRSGS